MRPHAPTPSVRVTDRPTRVRSFVIGPGLGLLLAVAGCASTGSTGSTSSPTPAPATIPAVPALAADAETTADVAAMPMDAPTSQTTDPGTDADAAALVPAETSTPPADDPRTQAEIDYAAIYGGQDSYNPVADPTLPEPARMSGGYDPWESYNRQMHRFNNLVDRTIARPLARAYVAVVPRPVRLGVRNFFSNLGQPVSAVNALLQGKPKQAAQAIGRFALNSTLGIGGIFDPASDARLSRRSEDFGQTLGIWGWEKSRYVELPLFGPRTVRDVFGMVGDAPLSPLRQVNDDATRIPLQGLQLVDVRTQLLATDSLREGAADDYALVRDAWMQRRDYQIFGDRRAEEDEVALPDYLRDDSLPIVPAGAVPVMPTDG
ncbi:MlaA family lipoprotein [Lysobacter sp. F6437]|uniref:MlaA family lipoprotein n=1 Tax=Lysobacter sp. F6437 TaxID=3459296 RepID=UPI00403D6B34